MNEPSSSGESFKEELLSLVEKRIEEGLSPAKIEEKLQVVAQSIRRRARAKIVYVHECPRKGCDYTYCPSVSRIGLECDIHDKELSPTESWKKGDKEKWKYRCPEPGCEETRYRSFKVDREKLTCPIH